MTTPDDRPGPAGPDDGVTRRQVVIGGGAVLAAGLAAAAVGWRSWRIRGYWYRWTGAYGPPGTPAPTYPVDYESGTLASTHLAAPAVYDIAFPPGVGAAGSARCASAPVLLCLPGRSRPPGEIVEEGLRFGDYVADGIAKRGVTPFIAAAVQASDTYWHERAAGDDAMAMLFDDFIPHLRRDLGLRGPLALIGWSMGGYGALRAAELHPGLFRGVCAVSAALWQSFGGVGDAFDSAADYAANDVFAHAERLRNLPVRLDCGLQDPFCAADKAFVSALPGPPAGGFGPGGHNDAFWSKVAPAEVDFIGGVFVKAAPAS